MYLCGAPVGVACLCSTHQAAAAARFGLVDIRPCNTAVATVPASVVGWLFVRPPGLGAQQHCSTARGCLHVCQVLVCMCRHMCATHEAYVHSIGGLTRICVWYSAVAWGCCGGCMHKTLERTCTVCSAALHVCWTLQVRPELS